MSLLFVNALLLLGLVVASVPDIMVLGSSSSTLVMDQELPLKRCRYSRAYSMIQVRCTNLGLDEIPADLKTDIQVLDASVNRLRELTNESLAPYGSLAYVYLADNFIQNIQEAAFVHQRYLEVLDLTKNGCDDLPRSLFQLPYLRRLYLGHNKLTDSVFKLQVTSPLTFLQLWRNRLTRIPEIGPLPSLVHLNLSENSISTVSTEELAPFCFLKVLDLSKNPMKLVGCECHVLEAWTSERGIELRPALNCTGNAGTCLQGGFGNRTNELYENCVGIVRLREQTEKARSTWILIASCVAAFIICVFLALYCVHRRNKRRRRKLKEQQRLAANNANTELLNSNLQADNTENHEGSNKELTTL